VRGPCSEGRQRGAVHVLVTAYYNENDPGAANWLRELIAIGEIAPGVVDERSIKDVRADDLRPFAQCHFFAGIGVWSHALRRAGWPDDRPVGSGSCPCQPFSGAGKQEGFQDPRHLWPDWLRIILEARQQGQRWAYQIFGEQVADAVAWIDLVSADLEAAGYAFGSPDICAAGFSGAHRRQRFYWVADADNTERWADLAGGDIGDWPQTGRIESYGQPGTGGDLLRLANTHHHQVEGGWGIQGPGEGLGAGAGVSFERPPGLRPAGGLAHDDDERRSRRPEQNFGSLGSEQPASRRADPGGRSDDVGLGHHHHHQGPQVGSFTPDSRGAIRFEGSAPGAAGSLLGCDWLLCRDGKLRPVEAGTFPLAATSPERVGLLRGYGNGLDAEAAVNFIAAFLEAEMLS
jgi:DNA (cytosine-5)-methyltransferase 1